METLVKENGGKSKRKNLLNHIYCCKEKKNLSNKNWLSARLDPPADQVCPRGVRG